MQHALRACPAHCQLAQPLPLTSCPSSLRGPCRPKEGIRAVPQLSKQAVTCCHRPRLLRQHIHASAASGSFGGSGDSSGAAKGGLSKAFTGVSAFVQAQYLPLALSTALATGCLAPQLGVAAAGFNVSVVVTTAIFVLQVSMQMCLCHECVDYRGCVLVIKAGESADKKCRGLSCSAGIRKAGCSGRSKLQRPPQS